MLIFPLPLHFQLRFSQPCSKLLITSCCFHNVWSFSLFSSFTLVFYSANCIFSLFFSSNQTILLPHPATTILCILLSLSVSFLQINVRVCNLLKQKQKIKTLKINGTHQTSNKSPPNRPQWKCDKKNITTLPWTPPPKTNPTFQPRRSRSRVGCAGAWRKSVGD